MKNPSRWIAAIVVIILILAAIQWHINSGETSLERAGYPDPSAQVTASSTPATASSTSPASSTSVSASSSTKNLMHTVTIDTNKGTIVFETYDADAPKTVQNFITLADKGFYNGLIFHRVIEGFMIQGGDPTGTGMGGPGYKFADELDPSTASYKAGYVRGTVAMANAGPNTNGSQFFIVQKDTPLPNSYTIFGKVISGMDVVDAIAATPVDGSDKPLTPVTMTKVTVADTK
jgi:cyclophilin family peptidyl-prolyl cis-trans isomerase